MILTVPSGSADNRPLIHAPTVEFFKITMKIGIPKEIVDGERRVAATPDVVSKLTKNGLAVWLEHGAGEAADFEDAAYEAVGGQFTDAAGALGCDIVAKVRKPTPAEVEYTLSLHTLFRSKPSLLHTLKV